MNLIIIIYLTSFLGILFNHSYFFFNEEFIIFLALLCFYIFLIRNLSKSFIFHFFVEINSIYVYLNLIFKCYYLLGQNIKKNLFYFKSKEKIFFICENYIFKFFTLLKKKIIYFIDNYIKLYVNIISIDIIMPKVYINLDIYKIYIESYLNKILC